MREKREKYHHSLKALAIRERKIHIVGSPKLNIKGTPVFLDVESVPDRDFYYLIGIRIFKNDSSVQHSFWADTQQDERRIWAEFLQVLANPMAVAMAVQAFQNRIERGELLGVAALVVISAALIALAPAKESVERTPAVAA